MSVNSLYRVFNLTESALQLVMLTGGAPHVVTIPLNGSITVEHLSDLGDQALLAARLGRIRVVLGTEVITDWSPEVRGGSAPPPVLNPPVITSALTAIGTDVTAFNYQIAATNSPTAFNATGLPAGLSVNLSTGLISGSPSALGTSNVTISATNAGGTDVKTLVLTVQAASPPVFTFPMTDVTVTIGEYAQIDLTVEANPLNPPDFVLNGIPSGMNSYQQSAPWPYTLYGNPDTLGDYTVDITATNAAGFAFASLIIHVISVSYTVSNTPGNMLDGWYDMAEEGYFAYNYDTPGWEMRNGQPNGGSGATRVFRSQSNAMHAIFYNETYGCWMIADLSTWAGEEPVAMFTNVNNSNTLPPSDTNWNSAGYSVYVQKN